MKHQLAMRSVTAILLLSMLITICFSRAETLYANDTPATGKGKKVAILLSSESESFMVLRDNLQILSECSGISFDFFSPLEMGNSSEATVYAAKEAIKEGYAGIMLAPSEEATIPLICSMCEQAQVYWGIFLRNIVDENIKKLCEESPWYIGNVCEQEEENAILLAEEIEKLNAHKLVFVSSSASDTTCSMRVRGAEKAVSRLEDVAVLDTIYGIKDAADAEAVIDHILTAYPDTDCICILSSIVYDLSHLVTEAINERGLDIDVLTFDFTKYMTADMESGILKAYLGIIDLGIDPFYCAVLMTNTLLGTPICQKPSTFYVNGILVNDGDSLSQVEGFLNSENKIYFSKEEIQTYLLKSANPSLDGDWLRGWIENNELLQSDMAAPQQ